MADKSWVDDFIKRCEGVGWIVTYAKSGHYKVRSRQGLFTIPSTPSDGVNGRSYLNALAEARRHGLLKLESEQARDKENTRKLKIARDRAQNGYVEEPAEPARSETDAPPLADDRAYVDGIRVEQVAPAKLMGFKRRIYAMPQIEEVLLADGRVVHRCNSNLGPCDFWDVKGEVVRTHLGRHKVAAMTPAQRAERLRKMSAAAHRGSAKRVASLRAYHVARKLTEAEPAAVVDTPTPVNVRPKTEKRAEVSATSKPKTQQSLNVIIDGLETANRAALELAKQAGNVSILIRNALDMLSKVDVADAETVAKAAKFDLLKDAFQ